MRYEQLYRRLYCEPLLISPQAHIGLSDGFKAFVSGARIDSDFESMAEPCDIPEKPYEMRGSVAVAKIKGTMSREMSRLEMACGGYDTRTIEALAEAVEADTMAKALVLEINSPGGSARGIEEAANALRAMTKPTIAWTGDTMASGAYWVASACDLVYATQSSVSGSVGVYMYLLDMSKAYSDAGYKPEVIRSEQSPKKAIGLPGTKLTDEQRAELQASVDNLYTRFENAVRLGRPSIKDEALLGGVFDGQSALNVGLIDAVAPLSKAIMDAEKLSRLT